MGGSKLSRAELIAVVERIIAVDGTEAELDEMVSLLQANVPHPAVSDLIFWPEGNKQVSAEEVVDAALSYKPLITPPPKDRE